jgi:hypothetical protein
MRIENIHERALPAAAAAGELIDGLAGVNDHLWPHDRWPSMQFQHGLRVGSEGGHGPVRYRVIEHQPGRLARFRFTGPPGLIGEHRYELHPGNQTVLLRHVVRARTEGRMRWQWPLLFGPFHDALIEDSLDHAAATLAGTSYQPALWPVRVRVLRWLLHGLI